MPKLSQKDAPVGTRVLLASREYAEDFFEAEIAEWTAGGRVRLKYPHGACCWRQTMPWLVEILPAMPAQPA